MFQLTRESQVLVLALVVFGVIVYALLFGANLPDLSEINSLNNQNPESIENEVSTSTQDLVIDSVLDYSDCLAKSLEAEKNNCILEKAKANNDPDACLETSDFFQSDCFKAIALAKSNPDLCARINSNEIKYECYSELGKKMKDSSICLKIPLSKANVLRGTCLNQTAGYEKDP